MKVRYSHLSMDERRKIARWHEAKVPTTDIAIRLSRLRSMVFQA